MRRERNRLQNDYRHEKRKVKRLVKEIKDKIRTEDERKLQNDFQGTMKIVYKEMNKSKSTEFVSIRNSKGEMLFDTDGIVDVLKDSVDSIIAEILKYGGEYIPHRLCELINLCIEMRQVPDDRRNAIIVPIYKKKGR